MNNLEQNEKIISGRKKERLVGDALKACREWRQIFDKTGCTLQQAADQIGMPRKTLEDYFYTFKKAERIIDIKEYLDCKMGVIRKILKDKLMQNDTEQFFCLDEEFLKGED